MNNFSSLPFIPIPVAGKRWQTPEASAAYYGDTERLEQRFKEGASPNVSHKNMISPLEAAILGGKQECVEIILNHPLFDPTLTDSDLAAFALNGTDNAISACCELAAPVVFGCEFKAVDNAPLPEGITLRHITAAGNWLLLLRYAEHHGVKDTDRRRIAMNMSWYALEDEPQYGIRILARLLDSCPELLKHRAVQQCFCALALSNSIAPPQELVAFLHLLPKKIVLTEGSAFRWGGAGNLLSRWRSHLGVSPSPCLDLMKPLPDKKPTPQALDHILHFCTITGKITENRVSPLLVDIITYASNESLAKYLEASGVLSSLNSKHLLRAAQTFTVSQDRQVLLENLLKDKEYIT